MHVSTRIYVYMCLAVCDFMDSTDHGILQARILEWVAFPISRESSQPRDWTQVHHIAIRFFTSWATREAGIHIQEHAISDKVNFMYYLKICF